jgi:hypothetical protein
MRQMRGFYRLMIRVKGPVHRSSGLVTERNLNVRNGRL